MPSYIRWARGLRAIPPSLSILPINKEDFLPCKQITKEVSHLMLLVIYISSLTYLSITKT